MTEKASPVASVFEHRIQAAFQFKILGRPLNDSFHRYFEHIEERVTAPVVFGQLNLDDVPGSAPRHWGGTMFSGGVAHVWVDANLDDDAYSHTLAHEFEHVLGWIEDKPTVYWNVKPRRLDDQVVRAARATGTLECVANDLIVTSYGLDSGYSTAIRYSDCISLLSAETFKDPKPGIPAHLIAAMTYVRAGLEQPVERFTEVRNLTRRRCRNLARDGDEIIARLRRAGFSSRRDRPGSFCWCKKSYSWPMRIGTIESNAQ